MNCIQETHLTVLTIMKAVTKMTNWTFRAKNWRGTTKKIGCLPLSNSFWCHESWRMQKLEKGEDNVSAHRHLSQFHTTNYMPFMREKGAF